MNTLELEHQWNEHSQSLRKNRIKRHGKKTRGARNKTGDDILQKARALEQMRQSEGRSPISKYEVVPPLRSKVNAYERTSMDEDSWGEASEDSDGGEYYASTHGNKQTKSQQAYPLPSMSFALVPVQHPGYLERKQPQPKRRYAKDGGKKQGKPVVSTRHEAGVNIETQTDLDVYDRPPASLPYLPPHQRSQGANRYSPQTLPREEDRKLLGDAALRFYDDRRFADRYTDDFVNSYLHDQMIPDILIEVFDEMYNQKQGYQRPRVDPPSNVSLIGQPMHLSPHPPVRTDPTNDTRVQTLIDQAEVSKQVVNDLVSDYINQQVSSIVRETCSEFVQGFMDKDTPDKTLTKLTDEITAETCRSMFGDILKEASEEVLLDHLVTDPVIDDLLIDVANETLEQYDSRVKEDEYKEISEGANEKFLDGIILDYLLEQIIRQERIYVDTSPAANFTQDGMMLDVLLRRITEVELSHSELLDIKPVKRFHERVVTDVVMDMLLNELCLNLDEDMKEYDEYERGLSDYLLDKGYYEDPSPSPQTI